MNILILGCRGFIGSQLCDHFTAMGDTVTGCDLIEYSSPVYTYHKVSVLSFDFEDLFTGNQFDVCINASGSGNVGYSITHPQSDFDANTVAVAKIAEVIRKFQPACKLLHISSAAVYGNPSSLPVPETAALNPVSPYGYHKYMSELLCREYAAIYKLQVAIIRPFSVYGNGLTKQLLWDISNKLQHNDNIELFGTGNETRDFLHIHDLVQLIQLLINKAAFDGNAYNAATGTETGIRFIADLFEKHFPGKKQVSFSGNVKAGDPVHWQADISKIQSLGFTPTVEMETAISNYIKWFVQLHR